MKIAIVGYHLFGIGGTSRSNINLITEFLAVPNVEITYYNTRKFTNRAVENFQKANPVIGEQIKYRHFSQLLDDAANDAYILTRENLFVLSKLIKKKFKQAIVVGEIHAPLPLIEPELELCKESIDVYRVATEKIKVDFLQKIGAYQGRVVAFPVSVNHIDYSLADELATHESKNLFIYSRFDETQKDISYSIKLIDYLVNYLGQKDFKLYINGSGPGETLYKNLAKYYRLQKNVFVNAKIPQDAIYLSTARYETFGYSISEAFTKGRKVMVYSGDDRVLEDIYGNFKTFGWLTKNIEKDAQYVLDYSQKSFGLVDFQADLAQALHYSIIENYGYRFIESVVKGTTVLTYEQTGERKEAIFNAIYAFDQLSRTNILSKSYNNLVERFPSIKQKLTQGSATHNLLKNVYHSVYKTKELSFEVRDDFAFIESFHGKSFSGDPKFMAITMKEQFPNMNFYVSSTNQLVDIEVLSYGFYPIRTGSPNYVKKFKQSRYVITNGNPLDKCGKQPGQKFIQTWHGFPLKKMVNDLEDVEQREEESTAFSPRMQKWDYLLTSSAFNSTLLQSAFNLAENKQLKVLEHGMPRNEYLKKYVHDEKEISRIHQKIFNRPFENQKYVLFCPTWRKGKRTEMTSLKLKEVIASLPKDYEIIVKLHPHEAYLRGKYANLDPRIHCFFNEVLDIQELFLLAEVLITDFSSAMFDFAHLNRKILILQEDAEDYNKQIGWYFDTEELLQIRGQHYSEEEIVKEILMPYEHDYNHLMVSELMNKDAINSSDFVIKDIVA